MDLGIHIFDQARFLLDEEATGVLCSTRSVLASRIEDSFASIIEFGDHLVSCDASMCSGSRVDLIEVATRGGQILADRYARRIGLVDGDTRREEELTGSEFTLGLLLKDFVRSVLDDTKPPITGEDGLRAVEIAQACYESARRSRKVRP